jgi:hypothetical protein
MCTLAYHASLKLDRALFDASTENQRLWLLAGRCLCIAECRCCKSTISVEEAWS